jgi:hypothetical protein
MAWHVGGLSALHSTAAEAFRRRIDACLADHLPP